MKVIYNNVRDGLRNTKWILYITCFLMQNEGSFLKKKLLSVI